MTVPSGRAMNITFRQIRYFISAAENGSISAAAFAVGISQSAITEAIRALEIEVGTALFHRHPKGVALTLAGHQFLRNASGVLDAIADIRRGVEPEGAPLEGGLRIGATPIVSGYLLPDLLARVRRLHPRIELTVLEDRRGFIEHLLINGELDLAVLVTSHLDDRAGLEFEVLMRSACKLWMPPAHRLAGEDSVCLADALSERLIDPAADELDTFAERVWGGAAIRPVFAMRTASREAVRSLVATGGGLALMPDLVYRSWSLEGDRILAKRLREPLPTMDIGIVWRRLTSRSPAAEVFRKLARAASDE